MHQNDTVGLPHKIKWITLCGLLMAINTIFSSFSVPVPGGHIYPVSYTHLTLPTNSRV